MIIQSQHNIKYLFNLQQRNQYMSQAIQTAQHLISFYQIENHNLKETIRTLQQSLIVANQQLIYYQSTHNTSNIVDHLMERLNCISSNYEQQLTILKNKISTLQDNITLTHNDPLKNIRKEFMRRQNHKKSKINKLSEDYIHTPTKRIYYNLNNTNDHICISQESTISDNKKQSFNFRQVIKIEKGLMKRYSQKLKK